MINPLTKMDYPDPDVIRVGDTYYMVSTTMHFMPGGALLRSYDLRNWEIVGYIYDTLDDTPAERMEQERTEYAGGMWAASLRYHEGMFYVVFVSHSAQKTYLFKATDPCGEWEKSEIEGYYHDCSLLFDEGRAFLAYGNFEIKLIELNEELTAPKQGGLNRTIVVDNRDTAMLGHEGSHLYKIGNYYYLFTIHWPKGGMRTECCFRADSLEGEFTGGEVLCDDAGYFGQGVAQGGIVDTPNGKWFAILFRDMGAVGRIPVLIPVSWKDDFPVFGIDGKVPEKFDTYGSRPGYRYEALYTSDKFLPVEGLPKERQLALQWQWNHQPDNERWRLLPEGGLEITTGKVCTNLTHARNCLTQRMVWPKCEAEVTIDASGINEGDIAGICALQSCYGFIGITKELGCYYLVKIVRKEESFPDKMFSADYMPGTVEEKFVLDDSRVTFCLKANFEDMKDKLDFYYFKNDRFVKVGGSHQMRFRLDHFTGNRFGLCYYATQKPGGVCVFKNFVYEA